jgi:hypothetical protein
VLRKLFAYGHAELAGNLLSEAINLDERVDVLDGLWLIDDLVSAGRPDLIERLAALGLPAARIQLDKQRVAAADDLDTLADEGVPGAQEERAKRLLAAADETRLRELAAGGDRPAQRQLAELMIGQGRPEDGVQLLHDLLRRDGGGRLDAATDIGPRLVEVLVELGDEEALRDLTDEGLFGVQQPLADYWFDQDDAEQLRRLAVSPDGYIRRRFVTVLERQGRYEEVEEMADRSAAAHKAAGRQRVAEADFPELLRLVVLGEYAAERAVRDLIEQQPERADLCNLARYGLCPDGTIATS